MPRLTAPPTRAQLLYDAGQEHPVRDVSVPPPLLPARKRHASCFHGVHVPPPSLVTMIVRSHRLFASIFTIWPLVVCYKSTLKVRTAPGRPAAHGRA